MSGWFRAFAFVLRKGVPTTWQVKANPDSDRHLIQGLSIDLPSAKIRVKAWLSIEKASGSRETPAGLTEHLVTAFVVLNG